MQLIIKTGFHENFLPLNSSIARVYGEGAKISVFLIKNIIRNKIILKKI